MIILSGDYLHVYGSFRRVLFRIYFAANLWFVVHFESVRIEGICTHVEMYFEYMYTKCGQDSRLV